MSKHLYSLMILMVLFSCHTDHRNSNDDRIIYELDNKHSEYIIEYFEAASMNSNADKYNLKKQFVAIYGFKERFTIHFNSCDDYYKNEQYMRLTNRFLRLSEDYFIPIVPSEDAEFSILEKPSNNLQNWVGSKGLSFIVDEDGSIQKMTIM
ncbi:hypothetical protein [Psychroserpens sp. SPM9]|uniref:hypothetical protein n=1 Tax=Psychroserpens sp. SPM9 TaxID=2975598 RepID=UPI0021A50F86|nr:hypothetical protein [Psychroserpens sp. SPM9]MDG5490734.1 hypothetical protein [Psychroserpens sp. SPM9]